MFQSINGHWHGARWTQIHPLLLLKKPVLSGRAASGLSQILCHLLQVSPNNITLLSLVFQMHPWFFCLLIFLLPFLVPCSSSQLILPLQSPVSPLLPLPCILFSGFMFLGEGQEQVGPLALHSTNMKYRYPCVCSMWVTLPWHSHKVELLRLTCTDFLHFICWNKQVSCWHCIPLKAPRLQRLNNRQECEMYYVKS